MKLLIAIVATITFAGNSFYGNTRSCLKNVYAPPLGKWGQEVLLSSCFGENVGCKFSVYEKTGDVPVRYQTKADQEDWKEYREGTFIKGQTIYVRATSTSITGVGTAIKADCNCKCD